MTREVADDGVSDAISDAAYDLLGNVTSETVYPAGTSNARTTATYFGPAGLPVGSRGPIVPTAAAAPDCPGVSPAIKCNTATSVDMNGRAASVTDAYGKVSLTSHDLAGKPAREVSNYVVGGASNSSQNVATISRYDAADRVVSVTDQLGRVTSTTYDALDRIVKLTRPDNSWISTVYRPSGRIDMESRPTATVGAEIWTKHVYDAAGRQTKTIDHYDTSAIARLWVNSFEGGTDGWSGVATGWFTANAATSATSSLGDGSTGARSLAVAVGSANSAGASLNVSGSTFKSGHTYRVRAWAKAPAGATLESYLGVDTSGGDYATFAQLTTTGGWQVIDGTWTPTADRTSNVRFAVRRSGTTALTFRIDDVVLWDASSSLVNPSGPDWNIPSETVYDAAGRTIESILPPGDPSVDGPLVTITTYDTVDQVLSVRTAATPDYPNTNDPDLDLLTTYGYDAVGNRTDVTDATGSIGHFDYDRRGNVIASTSNYVSGGASDAVQNVKARFAYNDRDEMTASCAPKLVQQGCDPSTPSATAWRYAYDNLGHIVTETPPANTTGTPMSATSYVYDTANGGIRLTRTCDHPAGGSCATSTRYIDTAYDALARVIGVTHLTGAAGSGTEVLRSEMAFDAANQQTGITYYESGVQKDALTFAYDDLGRQTVVSRGGTPVTTSTYKPDGAVATRKDHAISATASTFTYDWRGLQIGATSPTYTGSTTFAWRFDGLLATRTWPTGGNAASFTYDRAKRPVELTEVRSGVNQAVFTRSYNRAGDVTSESRTLSGVLGIAGNGSQTFTYDDLHRVTSSALTGGPSESYAYDANSNRVSWNDGAALTTYDFNESDELTAQHRSGVDRTFSYDAYGNMTSSAVASAGATSYTYDAQDRLTSITPPSGGALSFTLDALGRHWTKSVGGTLADTYGYIGASEAVVRIDQSSSTISAAIDALGNRTATATGGGGFGWLLPDLHGNVAGALNSGGTAISDAFRYDAYGVTIAKTTSSLPSPWRFQGRLLLNTADGTGVNTDLYDFVARAYDPALGVFTSLDSVRGRAQNPLTLNRFLYALANPLSMVDPDGHWGVDLFGAIAQVASNVGDFVVGAVEGVVDAGAAAVTGIVDLGKAVFGAVSSATACAANPGCRNATMAAAGRAVTAFVRDPAGSVRRAVDAAGNGLGAVANGLVNAGKGALDRVSTAWDTGNFRELGRMTGRVVGEVALSVVPVGALAKAGTVGRLLGGGSRLASGARATRPVVAVAGRAGPALNKALTASRNLVGAAKGRINTVVRRGCNSFSAKTLVATAAGAVAIAAIGIGDQVLAHDEATGQTASYPVSALHVNADPVTGTVVVAGETIETTPEHPFYTLEAGWLDAQDLEPGMHVPSASGDAGVVEAVDFSAGPAIMYNLTVEVAHTFFVGDGEWLVHNAACELSVGDSGRYGTLTSRRLAGDRLELNHFPQKAHGFTSQADGFSVAMTRAHHRATRTWGVKGRATLRAELGESFRTILARDIRNLRKINKPLYTPAIKKGLDYYKRYSPGLMQKFM